MTQMKNWQAIYALTLVLIVSSAWAEEKKPVAAVGGSAVSTTHKPAMCPKCCNSSATSTCGECCKDPCGSCSSPSSSKLVTRIHPLSAFFEAMESPLGKQKITLEEQVIKLITNHIQPGSWTFMGGQGTVDYFPLGRALIISQKAETHEQIAKFLEDLRSLVDADDGEEEEAQQCLPPRAFVDVPAPMYSCPAIVERIEHVIVPPYPYVPGACPVFPPMPVAPMPGPSMTPQIDVLQARMTGTEILPAPRPAPAMPVAQCAATQPAPCPISGCMVRARCQAGKTQLEFENCGIAMRAVCESMELKTAGCGSIKLSAQENQVRVVSHAFHAKADSLKCSGGSDWMLEGHVVLAYSKGAASAEMRGDRLMVSLKDGQVEFKFTNSSSATPSPFQPAMYLRTKN